MMDIKPDGIDNTYHGRATTPDCRQAKEPPEDKQRHKRGKAHHGNGWRAPKRTFRAHR